MQMKAIRFFATLILLFISNDIISQENYTPDCTQIINGKITDEYSNKPISNVTVEVRDLNEKLISTDITNSNGNYHFNFSCKQRLTILFSKEGYITSTTQIETTKTDKKVERRDIVLHEKICNQTINGIIVNSNTNEPVENASIIILKNNVEVSRFNKLSNGTFRYEAECLSQYKIKVSAPQFGFVTKLFKTTDINAKPFDVIFNLNHVNKNNVAQEIEVVEDNEVKKENVKEVLNISKNNNFELNEVHFELNKSSITKTIAIELDKIIYMMSTKPSITVELNSHTDNRGPKPYNQSLTESRAQSMISYIISKGIDATRVSGKGFGETKPLNKCSKEKRCTEAEHKKNKRIEFIISNNNG